MKSLPRIMLFSGVCLVLSANGHARTSAIRLPEHHILTTSDTQKNTSPDIQMMSEQSAKSTRLSPASQSYDYSVFAPKTQTSNIKLDYSIWDAALQNVVLSMGESLRKRARRPDPTIGTHIVRGHRTPFRLEGSRIAFSYLSTDYVEGLKEYRNDLVRIANEIDIQSLSQKEQLAFWYNLHNVLLIQEIAEHYPVKRPRELVIGPNNEKLHDAKLVTINGIPLSLRDIRTKIVYQNWHNPNVIYGFFLGDIGGPAIQPYAVTANNLNYVLSSQAHEFVNSLRGYHKNSDAHKVSLIYQEARPYLFKNWPKDLETHLKKHANEDVLKDLSRHLPFEFGRYDDVIADLMGGERPSLAVNVYSDGKPVGESVPIEIRRLAAELSRKKKILRKRGLYQGKALVTITDIETEDPDTPSQNEQP